MRTARQMSTVLVATAVLLVAGMAVSSAASPRHHHRRHHHGGGGGGGGGPSTFTVTEADNGASVTLAVGQTLGVELHGSSFYRFTAPASASPLVLARLGASAERSSGNAHGQFRGDHVGATEVTAVQSPSCYPQCLAPSLLWKVTVDVVPSFATRT